MQPAFPPIDVDALSMSRVNSYGFRAFSVLGPRLWNSLPKLLRDNSHNTTSFGHSLETFLLSIGAYSALGALAIMRYIQIYVLLT